MNPAIVNQVPAIDVRDVVKSFGHGARMATALKGVSLTIRDNEFFTLLGPSGCGKTTLLRILAGFEGVTAGAVHLFGADIVGRPACERPVNTVFQNYSLFPHMTVAENVAYGLRRLRRPSAEIESTVAKMLALVKMETFAHRRPAQLSGGQQQRVALARALAPHPKVLLLDEPLSALDLKLRQAMRMELKELQRNTGITFVFVTHDQEEALSMSDRIAVMSAGEVQQVGTPSEIYENPANAFVAAFIGDANFIPCEVLSASDGIVRCKSENGLLINAASDGDHKAGDQATLFLRPEKITLAKDDAAPIKGTIGLIEYLGDSTVYQVDIGEKSPVLVAGRNREDGKPHHAAGDTVALSFNVNSVRVLPR